MDINTLGDLKEFLGTLNEEQLKQEAVLMGLDEPGRYIRLGEIAEGPEVLTEDGWMDEKEYFDCFFGKDCDPEDAPEILAKRPAGRAYLYNEDFIDDTQHNNQ